jgi:hypothetical protein
LPCPFKFQPHSLIRESMNDAGKLPWSTGDFGFPSTACFQNSVVLSNAAVWICLEARELSRKWVRMPIVRKKQEAYCLIGAS